MRAAGLTEVQLARLVCPIGVPGLESKDPAVIAVSTASQLLIVSEKLRRRKSRAPGAKASGCRLRRVEGSTQTRFSRA